MVLNKVHEGFAYIVQSSAACDFRFKSFDQHWFSIISFVFWG